MSEIHLRLLYPFTAIVGQSAMKKALILNAINPGIGGVLIKGERGTAKSTAVRSLAALLPEHAVVLGCMFGCDPERPDEMCEECRKKEDLQIAKKKMQVIELPISATEDKVVGSLDISAAIKTGDKRFEPGILAFAHRNILYVDEVNLLNDHIVDVLLDAAAMGINIVEREGVSFIHPSAFLLVGTMNPEEGDLRPQLLDRFGLCVEIEGIRNPDTRLEIIRRRMDFESDPQAFSAKWAISEKDLADTITTAQEMLPKITIPSTLLRMIVQICIDAGVDGHRGDITMMKVVKTLAAYYGKNEPDEDDVREAAQLVLTHRMKKTPFSNESLNEDSINDSIEKSKMQPKDGSAYESEDPSLKSEMPESDKTTQFAPDSSFQKKPSELTPQLRIDDIVRESTGRRTATESENGKYTNSRIPPEKPKTIALDATLRAAAPHQKSRDGNLAVTICSSDIRERVMEEKTGNTIIFVVDASGSMGVKKRMSAVKGAVLSLLIDAYQKRDKVGIVTFRGDCADLLLSPTSSVDLAETKLKVIPTGGRTPLGKGLQMGFDVLSQEIRRDPKTKPLLILISDGKANVSSAAEKPLDELKKIADRIQKAKIPSLMLDSEAGLVRLGYAEKLAKMMGAKYMKLDEIASGICV